MLDALPLSWLFEQDVPLIFFILAMLTRPATWSKKAGNLFSKFSPTSWVTSISVPSVMGLSHSAKAVKGVWEWTAVGRPVGRLDSIAGILKLTGWVRGGEFGFTAMVTRWFLLLLSLWFVQLLPSLLAGTFHHSLFLPSSLSRMKPDEGWVPYHKFILKTLQSMLASPVELGVTTWFFRGLFYLSSIERFPVLPTLSRSKFELEILC